MPENPELPAKVSPDKAKACFDEADKAIEAEIYRGPIICTKFWYSVLQKFFKTDNPGDLPPLPRGDVLPGWGYGDICSAGSLDRVNKYYVYVRKCKKFARNALVVFLLEELKRHVTDREYFKKMKRKIDQCLEDGWFDITEDERKAAEAGVQT